MKFEELSFDCVQVTQLLNNNFIPSCLFLFIARIFSSFPHAKLPLFNVDQNLRFSSLIYFNEWRGNSVVGVLLWVKQVLFWRS